ncbi:MAG: proton-translocating transhydrogenase family protein [Pseudomonadota bacterium]
MSDMTASEAAAKAAEAAATAQDAAASAQSFADAAAAAVTAGAEAVGASTGVDPFIFRIAIFVLAIFVGYYVVWSVTPALHTPLMSVTNAISSVIVVGALLAVASSALTGLETAGISRFFGFVALVLASVNIFGGFLVTQRMLAMYKKKER